MESEGEGEEEEEGEGAERQGTDAAGAGLQAATDPSGARSGGEPTLTIRSGAQTGVDTAAIEFAIASGMPYVGWIPQGRRCEGGVVPARFDRLTQVPSNVAGSAEYNTRTEM